MTKEYNQLTKKLLSEGYTIDNHPDYVRVGTSRFSGNDPLNNLYGGFEYIKSYADQIVYKTGCGKHILGKNVFGMSWNGIEWCHENGNPVFRCPYNCSKCERNNLLLNGTVNGGDNNMSFCSCSTTEEEYDYSKSIEKIIKEKREERDQKFLDFSESRSGRVCRTQMRYNEAAQAWELHYRPENCAQMKCFGYCPILGKNLDRQKGNVYYDVKLTYRRYDLDGTFFEGQVDTQIVKGKRFFKNPVSMDICKAFVKLQKDDLKQFVLLNQYHTELFFAKTRNLQYSVEILNIRAEHRESRDLFQDLEDLKAGILITHESDKVKADKAVKSQRRQIAKEKRIHRLEKKVLETGYEKLEPFEQEKISRLLGADRLAELEKERAEKPVVKIQQLNLLDFA